MSNTVESLETMHTAAMNCLSAAKQYAVSMADYPMACDIRDVIDKYKNQYLKCPKCGELYKKDDDDDTP